MNREDLHEGMLVAIGNKKLLYTHKALQGIVLQVGGWTARSNFGRKRIENFRQKPSGKMVAIGQRDHNGVWTPEVISLDRILMPWEEYERFMSSNTP